MKCKRCGENELSSGDFDGICQSCKNTETIKYVPMGYGQAWVCPKCGSVYGPTVQECWRCNANKNVWTSYTLINNCIAGTSTYISAKEIQKMIDEGRITLT